MVGSGSVAGEVTAAEGPEAAAGLTRLITGSTEGGKARQKRKKANKENRVRPLRVPTSPHHSWCWCSYGGLVMAVSSQGKPLSDACGAG